MKKIHLLISIAVILVLLTVLWFINSPSRMFSRADFLMDTFFEIKVYDPNVSRSELESIFNSAITYGKKLENKFDMFNPASEINLLNLNGKHKCTVELFELLHKALGVSEITGGKFDITISPVLNAKGFYSEMPAGLRKHIPDSLEGVGRKNVFLDPESRESELLNKAWVDLSGIAKGYIVSKISDYLKDRGIKFFLINAGGDIYCTAKRHGQFWKIGVREPDTNKTVLTIKMKNMAVATSGDYENVIKNKDGKSFISHIIDPSTKEAIIKKAKSVTVITPDAAVADALATAFMTMSIDEAVSEANDLSEVEIIVFEHTPEKDIEALSDGADKYILKGEK